MTGIHEFRIKKALQQGDRISVRQLKKTLSRLYEVDRNIKNGQMDGTLALELIIAGV
jgi:DNA polymerase III subunit delta